MKKKKYMLSYYWLFDTEDIVNELYPKLMFAGFDVIHPKADIYRFDNPMRIKKTHNWETTKGSTTGRIVTRYVSKKELIWCTPIPWRVFKWMKENGYAFKKKIEIEKRLIMKI